MISELTMLNQWMLAPSADCRYVSHRDAHLSAAQPLARVCVHVRECD
jgi:hypothetical protein